MAINHDSKILLVSNKEYYQAKNKEINILYWMHYFLIALKLCGYN